MYTGPTISTSGLVLYLDAANRKSFINGATTWYDLSKNNNNGMLISGGTFSDTNGGSIVFDGDNDYVELGLITSDNPLSFYNQTQQTLDIWLNSSGTADDFQRVIDKSNGGSSINGWGLYFPNGASKTIYYFVNNTSTSYTLTDYNFGDWVNIVFVRGGSDDGFFINGVKKSSNTLSTSFPSTTTGMRIGTWNHSTGREFGGKISTIKLYNRALSSSEILQNYNATKSRFGL